MQGGRRRMGFPLKCYVDKPLLLNGFEYRSPSDYSQRNEGQPNAH